MNINFLEIEEIRTKVETIRLYINSLISSSDGSISDTVRDVLDKNTCNGYIIFTSFF